MSRNHWVRDVIELCEEQGFAVVNLIGGTGVRVMPKNLTAPPVVLYRNAAEHDYQNKRAELRRIGVRFPDEHHKPKRDHGEPMAANPTTGRLDTKPAEETPIDHYAVARQKINAAVDALSDAAAAIDAIEASNKGLSALKAQLKAALL